MTKTQKFLIFIALLLTSYILYLISSYWYADTLYSKGTKDSLQKAVTLFPNEPLFRMKLAQKYVDLNDPQKAISEMQKAVAIFPSNVNLKRAEFSMFIKFSLTDSKYLINAINALEQAIQMAPTDAKLFYNLGLTYYRIGDRQKAIKTFEKTILMKSNYDEAQLALKYILEETK